MRSLPESHFVVGMHQGPKGLDLSFLEKGAVRLKWAGFTGAVGPLWVLWAQRAGASHSPLDGPAPSMPHTV